MLEVDEDSRLGREMLGGGARYFAEQVPADDAIAQMYSVAIEKLEAAGLGQYEISNFCRPGFQSRHNLRYWQRRPYLGLGLDASSMLREALHTADSKSDCLDEARSGYVLRSTTTHELGAFLGGAEAAETAWLSPAGQHEEAWFLGLRLNAGVDLGDLELEFASPRRLARAMEAVRRLAEAELVVMNGKTVCLTEQGRLLSNDVFQEFLGLEREEQVRPS
jgi:oxygen-independent coproporphyrinogen-3 oxidase